MLKHNFKDNSLLNEVTWTVKRRVSAPQLGRTRKTTSVFKTKRDSTS